MFSIYSTLANLIESQFKLVIEPNVGQDLLNKKLYSKTAVDAAEKNSNNVH